MDDKKLLKIENLTTDCLPKNRIEIIVDVPNNRRIDRKRHLLFKTKINFFKIYLWKIEEAVWNNYMGYWSFCSKIVERETNYRIEILRYAFGDTKGWQIWFKPNVKSEKGIYDMTKKIAELLENKNPKTKEDFVFLVFEMFGDNLEILNGDKNE